MIIAVVVAALTVTACASVSEGANELRQRVSNIEFGLDATLDQARDCGRISDLFVSAVRTAAVGVDGLAARTDGRVPTTEIQELVDKVSVSNYYDLGAKVGCAKLQLQLATIEQLRSMQDETQAPAGNEFLEELMRRLEQNQ